MTFQREDLVMLGVGIDAFRQPSRLLPEITSGVHLRWSFPRERGFPWFGYYLLRRKRFQAKPRCFQAHRPKKTGNLERRSLRLPAKGDLDFGRLTSDRSLVLDPEGAVDLRGRERVALTLPDAHPAHWVRLDLRLLRRTRVEVRFLLRGRLVGRRLAIAKLQARSVRMMFEADAIDGIEISGGEALLRELCFISVRDSVLDRPENPWKPLIDFTYPLMLPVRGPEYFRDGPSNADRALRLALERLQIGDAERWDDDSFGELHELLQALVASRQRPMHEQVLDGLVAAGESGRAPSLGGVNPLDLVQLAALEPAVAQMVGLYQVDRHAESGQLYDYCLIADRRNRCRGSVLHARAFLSRLDAFDADDMDLTFLAGRGSAGSEQPATPEGLEVYALPTAPDPERGSVFQTGLRWRVEGETSATIAAPEAAVFYHLWRAKAGDSQNLDRKPSIKRYRLTTAERPILALAETEEEPPASPAGWPPHRLLALDRAVEEGWYSYRTTGVDLFGRHSRFSDPSVWQQWQQRPRPRPWYFSRPAVNGPVEGFTAAAFAVRLLDKQPPPRPQAVEAQLLDPEGPLWVRDAAAERWLQEHDGRLGLRVRWSWPQTLAAQAPDARELRVYVHPGLFNTLFARVREVEPDSGPDGEAFSQVTLDVEGDFPSSLWRHAELRAGGRSYRVVDGAAVPGSDPGLRLRIANRGPRSDVAPQAGMDAGLTLPSRPSPSPVRVRQGSAVVVPEGDGWSSEHQGLAFRLAAEPDALYGIRDVSPSGRKVVLNRSFREPSGDGLEAELHHVHAIRPQDVGAWQARLAVVDIDDAIATTLEPRRDRQGRELAGDRAVLDGSRIRLEPAPQVDSVRPGIDALELHRGRERDGPWTILAAEAPGTLRVAGQPRLANAAWRVVLPVRHYELLAELPFALETRPDRPKAYFQVGVTAADGRAHSPDTFRRADPPRVGNESRVAGPVAVFAVHRQPPPAAELPAFDQERLYTSVADVQGRSQFRLPLVEPPAGYSLVIHRALDESLFEAARGLDLRVSQQDRERFPAAWFEGDPAVGEARVEAVVAELASAHAQGADPAALRELSDLALRVLAAHPGSEGAYRQLGAEPLPGREAAAGYLDELDGKASNLYFYRASLVDAAGNRGPLGGATPPVALPRLFAPEPPIVTSIRGVDRGVLLRIASVSDPEIARLRVFRSAERTEGEPPSAVATLPAQPLVTRSLSDPQRVGVDLGAIEAAELIALYDATFDFEAEPLDRQPAAPLVADLAGPVEDRIHAVDLPADQPVVLLYRDARGTLQATPVAGVPLRFVDGPLPAPRTWHYRLVAERLTGSAEGEVAVPSRPSPSWSARALARTPPPPPQLTLVKWVLWDGERQREFDPAGQAGFRPAVALEWQSAFPFATLQVQRASAGSTAWRAASPPLPAEATRFVDATAGVERGWRYRLRGTDGVGAVNLEFHELELPVPREEES